MQLFRTLLVLGGRAREPGGGGARTGARSSRDGHVLASADGAGVTTQRHRATPMSLFVRGQAG
eukprot:329677-Chlamydomonas_euryale.AAC.3